MKSRVYNLFAFFLKKNLKKTLKKLAKTNYPPYIVLSKETNNNY